MLGLTERLESRPLVGDGAMGTLLADREAEHPPDKAVLTHPQIVRDLHEEHPRGRAGHGTNTYAANSIRLEARSLAEEAWETNAAVDEALQKGEEAFVFGAVGPLGRSLVPMGPVT